MNNIAQIEQNKSITAILQYNLNKNQTTMNSLLNHSRIAIYINNNILSTTSYESIQLSSSDATAIAIKSKHKKKPTLLINIYNACDNDQINKLKTSLRKLVQERKYGTILIIEDFNLHHSL